MEPGVTLTRRPPLSMIAITLPTPGCGRQNSRLSRKVTGAQGRPFNRRPGARAPDLALWIGEPAAPLLEQDSGAADLLRAEGAEERGHHPVHQLEIGRQRRDALLR